MRKLNDNKDEPTIARDEWEFSKCPPGWKPYCWDMEFQREELRWRIEHGEKYSPEMVERLIGEPHLSSPAMQDLHKMTDEDWDNLYGVGGPPSDSRAIFPYPAELKADQRSTETRELVMFSLDWTYPDKRILKGFAYWLKQLRKSPAKEKRGNREIKAATKNLNQLGAYRLMKASGSLKAARAYSEKILSKPIYAKDSDWYEAKSCIQRKLQEVIEGEKLIRRQVTADAQKKK